MARLLAILTFLTVAGVTSGARTRRQSVQSNATVLWETLPPRCEPFKKLPLIKDFNFTGPVLAVCRVWPAKFGEFPVKTVTDIVNMLELSFGTGGVWDLVQLIFGERKNKNFCWRGNAVREIDQNGCQMEVDGECYGSCPAGFKPKFLSGRFRPVCDTACIESEHPYGCGLGCATNFGTCAKVIMDQVSEVASVVGLTSLGGPLLPIIDQVIDIADFVYEVVERVIPVAKKVWELFSGPELNLALALTIFQVIAEVRRVGEDLDTLFLMMGEVFELIMDLIEGERSGLATAKFISDTLLKNGVSVIRKLVAVINVFSFPTCKVVDSEVAFAVEEAGRAEVLGPYIQRGEKNGHPYYTLQGSTRVGVEYDTRAKAWSMFAPVGATTGFKTSFYQVPDLPGAASFDYPVQGWVRNYGAEPAPKVVSVREPVA